MPPESRLFVLELPLMCLYGHSVLLICSISSLFCVCDLKIEVLWSKGIKKLPPLVPILVKGRKLYKFMTFRQVSVYFFELNAFLW